MTILNNTSVVNTTQLNSFLNLQIWLENYIDWKRWSIYIAKKIIEYEYGFFQWYVQCESVCERKGKVFACVCVYLRTANIEKDPKSDF